MKRILLVLLLAAVPAVAYAQTPGEATCSDFDSQEEAQEFYDEFGETSLDGDEDGIACESFDYGDTDNDPDDNSTDTAEEDDITCKDFRSREEAEEYVKDTGDLEFLDNDEDGRICDEELPHERGAKVDADEDDGFGVDDVRGDPPRDLDDPTNVHDKGDGIVSNLPTPEPVPIATDTTTETVTEDNGREVVQAEGASAQRSGNENTPLRALALVCALLAIAVVATLRPVRR